MTVPRRIAVVGGTHGNEHGGIVAVEVLRARPDLRTRPGLVVDTFLGNPEAILRNVRFVDVDLNRCFGPNLCHARHDHPMLERRRAFELTHLLCPDGTPYDLVVDLHNTTSLMGVTWILTSLDPWSWWLAAQSASSRSDTHLLHFPKDSSTNVFLPSLGRHELTLEIGPCTHGVRHAWAVDAALEQITRLLDLLADLPDDANPRSLLGASPPIDTIRSLEAVPWPEAVDGVPWMATPQLLSQGYRRVDAGFPLFVNPLDGRLLRHETSPFIPVFAAEAAYLSAGIAWYAAAPCTLEPSSWSA